MTDPLEEVESRPAPNLRDRILRPRTFVSLLVALFIIVFLVTRLDIDLHEVWGYIKAAKPWPLVLAVCIYYSTFVLRGYRWRGMLEVATADDPVPPTLPTIPRFVEIMILAWFVNSVVPAKLGDAYRCYLIQQDTGIKFSTSLGTILVERLLDLTVLFTMMTAAGLYAFSGHLPDEVKQTLIIGSGMLALGLAVVGAMAAGHRHIERFIPAKVKFQYGFFRSAVLACLRKPWKPLGISLMLWSLDGCRVYLVAYALGAHLAPSLAIFVALMAALLSTLPLTPAGLGVVEAGVVVVLKLVDIDPSLAGSIAVVDRLITFWSLLLVGLFLYLYRLRQDVRIAPEPAT